MDLPTANVATSAAYYRDKMKFNIVEVTEVSALLERDGVQMAIAANGRDPGQDGCAFETDDIEGLRAEFIKNGVSSAGNIKEEKRGDGSLYKAFFVVAPDGLCYWFGEKQK